MDCDDNDNFFWQKKNYLTSHEGYCSPFSGIIECVLKEMAFISKPKSAIA